MASVSVLAAFLRGFGLGASLIVAVGAQNAFVMRQGLRREHVLSVVLVCFFSDALLMIIGAGGLGYLVTEIPFLIPVARWTGAIFLSLYALRALYNALHPNALQLNKETGQPSWAKIMLICLAFTWLNPSVYLDTVFLVGSISNTFPGISRWFFVVGAIMASFVWFFGIGFGSSWLAPLFTRKQAWQVFDLAVAIILVVSATLLVLP